MKIPYVIISPTFTKLVSWVVDVSAITLYPFIIAREKMSDTTLQHESIHIAQQKELFVLLFYILYFWDWVYGLIKYKNKEVAYCQIRFEQEAYEHMTTENYLSKRKRYSWRTYRV